MEDRAKVRVKYGLPNRHEYDENPREYLGKLYQIAKTHGVSVRKGYEIESFFDMHPGHNAMYVRDDKTIFTKLDIDYILDEQEFMRNVFFFEHELIHALQDELYPGMPIEVMEYEAYATSNIGDKILIENPNDSLISLFGMKIPGSLRYVYEQKKSTPIWEKIVLPGTN